MSASVSLSADQQRRRFGLFDMITAVLIFAVTTLFAYRFAVIDFDAHHTGLMYKTALDLAEGKVIYRDTFSQYGALTSFLQAAAIRVLGARVTSVLFSTAFFYGLDYLLFFKLSRRFLDRTTAVLLTAATLFMVPYLLREWAFHPWSSVYALFFLLLTILLVWRAEERRPCLFYALAGLSSALAFWCRQPVGFVCLLATVLCPLVLWFLTKRADPHQKKKRLLSIVAACGGAGVGVFAFLIPIIALGAFPEFYKQNFVFNLSLAGSLSQSGGVVGMLLYRLLLAPWEGQPLWLCYVWAFLPFFSVTLFILSALQLHKAVAAGDAQKQRLATLRLIFALFAVASWHQYYPVSCQRHWYWSAFPSILSALLLIIDLSHLVAAKEQWKETLRRVFVVVLMAALLGPGIVGRVVSGVHKISLAAEREPFENANYRHLDGLYLSADEVQHYNEVFDDAALLHQLFPDVNIINVTGNGVYALLGENFSCYFTDISGSLPDEYPIIVQNYVDANRPVVFSDCAPDDTYRLWRTPGGWHGDLFAAWHRLPGSFWLPVELYDRLPEGYK